MAYAPGLQNVFALLGSRADDDDQYFPYTPRTKLDTSFSLTPRPGLPGHFPESTNLMRDNTAYDDGRELHDTVDGPKRLTELPFMSQPGQHVVARTESGPDTTPPILRRMNRILFAILVALSTQGPQGYARSEDRPNRPPLSIEEVKTHLTRFLNDPQPPVTREGARQTEEVLHRAREFHGSYARPIT